MRQKYFMQLFLKIFNWLKKHYLWIILISVVFLVFFYPDDTIDSDAGTNFPENQVDYYEETDNMEPEIPQEHQHDYRIYTQEEPKHFRGFYHLAVVVGGSITIVGLIIYRVTSGH